MTLQVSNSLGLGILDPLPRENIGWWIEVYDFESHNTLLARLYRTKFSFSTPLGDTGAWQLAMAMEDPVFSAELPTGEAGSELLTQPHWFVMVDEGQPRFRGFLDTINKDKVTTDGVRLYTLSGPGIAAAIGWGIALPIDPTGSKDRTFADTTWASVFTTLFLEAQERGAIPDWFTLTFTGAKDTYNQSWTDVGDHTVPAGANLLEMLKQFSETYGFEWHVTQSGDVIAASRVGQDRAQEVRFFESTTVITASDVEDRKDMATDIFVADGEGGVTEVSDPTAIVKYGRREVWVAQGEITGAAARSNVGNTLLLAGKEPLKSRTFKVPFKPLNDALESTNRRCFVDYVLGDTIGYGQRISADDDYRVVEIAIGVDGSTELELTLTSRRQRDLEKLNRLIKRILSGQTGAASNAGASSVTSTVNVALSSINLEDLYNVERYNAVGGEFLVFDSDIGKWKATNSPLENLSDVEILSPADRDFLIYDIGLGKWTNPSISIDDMDDVSTKGGDAPTSGQVLTWSGGRWHPETPSGGGGGGGGGRPPFDETTLDATYGDEFDTASLDAKWSRHNLTSGDETYQTDDNGWLNVFIPNGSPQARHILQSCPAGDWTAVVSMVMYGVNSTNALVVLEAMDSSGNGISVSPYDDGGYYMWFITAYDYSSTGGGGRWPGAVHMGGEKHWNRLRKVGTTYYGSVSRDGHIWSKEISATWAGTPDRFGFGRIYNSGVEVELHVDRFNVI